MAKNSKIEWCDHTVNLWWGCTKVHAGCDNCYAETLSNRWNNDLWGNDKPRKEIKSTFTDLAKYEESARKSEKPLLIFVGSMMDIFEKPMPLVDSTGKVIKGRDTGTLRKSFFAQIDFGRYPNLIFLMLTKRPSNINKYIPECWKEKPPSNVMFGTSPSTQQTANILIPQLLLVKGKKFLSVEPQLSKIDFLEVPTDINRHWDIDWIIQGGESGHHKRPFNLDWAYAMQLQCRSAEIPYFFKQIDKIQPIPEDLNTREFPEFFKK